MQRNLTPASQVEVGRPWVRGLQPQLHPKAEEHSQAYQPAIQPQAPAPSPPLGSLSYSVFERRTSTGSGLFASLGSGLVQTLG